MVLEYRVNLNSSKGMDRETVVTRLKNSSIDTIHNKVRYDTFYKKPLISNTIEIEVKNMTFHLKKFRLPHLRTTLCIKETILKLCIYDIPVHILT